MVKIIMRLLLTSNGICNELRSVFLSLITKNPAQLSVAFITTPAYGEDEDIGWLEDYRNELKNLGIVDIEDLDLKEKTKEELKNILEQKDIIFMNGGNTYYLLKYVRESGFDKLLPQLLNQGKLYVGVSAGSIILGPSIELAGWNIGTPDTNKVNLADLTGLYLVPFSILPHFEENQREALQQYALQVSYPIYVLTNTQAVLVEDYRYTLVGIGEKLIFNELDLKK